MGRFSNTRNILNVFPFSSVKNFSICWALCVFVRGNLKMIFRGDVFVSLFWIESGIDRKWLYSQYYLISVHFSRRFQLILIIEMDPKVQKVKWEIAKIDFFHYIEKFSKSQRSKSGNKIFSNIPRKLLNWPRMTKIEVPLREKKRNYGIFVHLC